jgi:hypothetical protein
MPLAEWVGHTLLHVEAHPPARVDSILNGIADIAARGGISRDAAYRATAWLQTAAAQPQNGPLSSVFGLLERVHAETADPQVQIQVLRGVPNQAVSATQAAQFLERAAQENRPHYASRQMPPPYAAVQALLHLEAEGRAALQRLHASGAVDNPAARSRLNRIASQGFRGN